MGLFEVLASTDDIGPRAVIAAQTRAKSVFERFVAGDESKLAYIADDLKRLAAEVADEYGYDKPEELYLSARQALGGGHAADCSCGFCVNKGSFGKEEDDEEEDLEKESSTKTSCDCPAHKGGDCTCDGDCGCTDCADSNRESSTRMPRTASVSPRVIPVFDWEHIAAEVETGDSYQHERESLPESDGSGLGETGAVPTDKSKSGDQTGWNLEPIDVGSKKNQEEQQDAPDKADYNNEDFDPSNPVRERIDATKSLVPEKNVAPNTETWSDAGTQASPVTSKWKILA